MTKPNLQALLKQNAAPTPTRAAPVVDMTKAIEALSGVDLTQVFALVPGSKNAVFLKKKTNAETPFLTVPANCFSAFFDAAQKGLQAVPGYAGFVETLGAAKTQLFDNRPA